MSNVDKKTVDGEVPVRLCNYTDVYYQTRLHQGLDYMLATARADQRRAFGLRVGDTVITKDSETADDIGVAALVTETAPDFVCGYHLAILRPGPALEPRYLHWQVASRFVQEQLAVRASGVTRYGLTYDAIRGASLAVPPLEEQRRVADFLDEQLARLDAAARAASALVNMAGARRESALAELVDGRDPQTPLRRMLRDACVGVVVEPSRYFQETGVPFVHGYNVRDGWLDRTELKYLSARDSKALHRSMLRAGDVLVVRAGEPGRAAVVTEDMLGGNCASVLVLRPDPSRLLPDYLVALVNGPTGRSQVLAAQYGAAQGVVNLAEVRAFVFGAPQVDEQRRRLAVLEERLASVRDLRSGARRLLQLLQERKRALITACVTGEFDVSTASTRAADAALKGLGC